ncbi:MAG: hypothetical protein MUE41_07595 [Gemmatimonadaceae bacterium]|nr:hypothetical protein [Gemmatimonadaceae bacterium]
MFRPLRALLVVLPACATPLAAQSSVVPDTSARWAVELGIGAEVPSVSVLRAITPRLQWTIGGGADVARQQASGQQADGFEGSVTTTTLEFRSGLRFLGPARRVRPLAEVGLAAGRQSFFTSANDGTNAASIFGGYLRGGVQLHVTSRVAAVVAVEGTWARVRSDIDVGLDLPPIELPRSLDVRSNQWRLRVPIAGLTLFF